ncbi:MAG TPA: multicopper oxidase domain-containing protein, partial [Bacteroidota bacterium]
MRSSISRRLYDFTRRNFLKTSIVGLSGSLGWKTFARATQQRIEQPHGMPMPEHDYRQRSPSVDPGAFPKLDPMKFLTDFDYGTMSRLPSGQVVRDYSITAFDREVEVAPGVFFPAWTYNGTVPGPTLRSTEGDLLRIHFRNEGS